MYYRLRYTQNYFVEHRSTKQKYWEGTDRQELYTNLVNLRRSTNLKRFLRPRVEVEVSYYPTWTDYINHKCCKIEKSSRNVKSHEFRGLKNPLNEFEIQRKIRVMERIIASIEWHK